MKLLNWIKENRSTILSGVAVAGVIGTAVSAAIAADKALKQLNKATLEKGAELTKVEKLEAVAPCFVPTVLIGSSTVICIMGANVLSKRDQAALISAYTLLENSFKEYREKLVELHGAGADEEIQDALAREQCNYHVIDLDVPDTKRVFVEPITGEKIERYERDIIDAEYHFNRNFAMKGFVSLNEFLYFLGIPQVIWGEDLGWSAYDYDDLAWIDFAHEEGEDEDGNKIVNIVYIWEPDKNYLNGWEV